MKLFMTKKFQGQQSHPKPKTLATRGAEQKEFTLLAKNLRPLYTALGSLVHPIKVSSWGEIQCIKKFSMPTVDL